MSIIIRIIYKKLRANIRNNAKLLKYDILSQMVEASPIDNREQRIKDLFEQNNAYLKGHFIYSSKKHGEQYVNKDALYPDTKVISELCKYMAEPFRGQNIDTVLGPALGGIILAHSVAEHLTQMEERTIYGIFAEKTKDGNLEIKRGYEAFIKGKNVLVVEDVLNTGGSAKKAIDAVRQNGGNVVALSALMNRGEVMPEDIGGVPISSLLDVVMDRWEPEECPLCEDNVPINTNVGHAGK